VKGGTGGERGQDRQVGAGVRHDRDSGRQVGDADVHVAAAQVELPHDRAEPLDQPVVARVVGHVDPAQRRGRMRAGRHDRRADSVRRRRRLAAPGDEGAAQLVQPGAHVRRRLQLAGEHLGPQGGAE
jgi:hypothetical protein